MFTPVGMAAKPIPTAISTPNFMTIAEAQPSLSQFPAEVKAIPHWVCWKLEMRKGKATKPPYVADGSGKRASVTDPATWRTYEEATGQSSDDYAGVGFVLTEEDGLVFIDLDHCIDAVSGLIADWALDIVRNYPTYWEFSPSRTGLHGWARSTLPGPGNKVGQVEMYAVRRYATVTGLHLAVHKNA